MSRFKCREPDCSCCPPLPAKYTDPSIYDRPGVPVTEFSEATFRAPFYNLFLGDLTLEDANPITRRWSMTPREDIPKSSPPSPIGQFDRFPREVLDKVLVELDVHAILKFREINQACMHLVDSLPAFQTVAAFPKALSAVITLRAFSYGIGHLACAIRNTKCSRCSHFGDHLYLITAERLCYPCWRFFIDYIPKKVRDGEISDELLRKVPHALALPGYYGAHGIRLKESRLAFHRPSLLAYRGEDDDSDLEVKRQTHVRTHWHAASDFNHDFLVKKHLFTIRAPYFDEMSESLVGGFFCRACATQEYAHENRSVPPTFCHVKGILLFWGNPYQRYTRETFSMHLEKYGGIIKQKDGRYAHTAKPSGRYLEWAWEQCSFYVNGPDTEEQDDRPREGGYRVRPRNKELDRPVSPNGDYEDISTDFKQEHPV
ncbi:F-box domain-containing protein [Colletotrichum sojae]|uniref:F-box domain-containing protein n=1 Tax=Colletotrichum sojae TaxID=2175907 RepID=A0A8H6MUC2_9PEZI|nr:F-box domain-containing protein [Colletotrichum sojae]